MAKSQLKEIRTITGQIEVVTGLRIGASAETLEIAGNDNPIIRNPANAEPFIPGSSIRGRMRSLAEWYFAEVPERGEVIRANPASRTGRVFGTSASNRATSGPTRLIVRDAYLSPASRKRFMEGMPITEIKSENAINRLTAMANPRPMERVLPGVTFDCGFVYRVFRMPDGTVTGPSDEDLFDEVLLPALALLQLDALGGGASRGNGKIRFINLTMNGSPLTLPELHFPAGASA